jgi:outer membrane receptor protein involved in Fe transport
MKQNNLGRRGSFKRLSALLLLLIPILMFSIPASAQQEAGQINGVVKDQNEAAIPGATVTVRNVANNATRTVTTSDDGSYQATNLQPGLYEVSSQKQGFQDAKESIQVTTGGRITLNLTAGVSTITADVTITSGGGAEINTTDQQLSTTITGRQIQEIPLLDRNPYSLVALSGNVSEADPSGRGAGVAINGQRAASTSILLDGAENSDTFSATIAQTTPLESVQEFQVITSNFSAEYGRASGGIVNVSTRAGGNRYRGSLFAFNRNAAFAANSFDNNANGIERPNFNRNQFGYSIGGPLPFLHFGEGGPVVTSGKDKLFFFNSTEWTRVRSKGTILTFVPTASYIASTNVNTQNFFARYATPLSGRLTGVTATQNGATFQQVAYTAPIDVGGGLPQNTYSTVTRIDWNITDRTQLYGRLATDRPNNLPGTTFNSPYSGYNASTASFNNNFLLNLTHQLSSNFISNSKFAYRRSVQANQLENDPNGPTLYLLNAAAPSINGTQIALPGYAPFNAGSGLPTSGNANLYQFNQDMSLVAGKHTFKFGGQYIKIADNLTFGAYQNASLILGSNLNSAIANLTAGRLIELDVAIDPQGQFPGGTLRLPVTSPNFTRNNRYNEYAIYGTDGWRITNRLTVNLGLRYEYYGPQKSTTGQDSNFYLGSGSMLQERIRNGRLAVASTKGGLWKPDKNNFAPRVGFALDVFGDGNTSIRGGYGTSYERNFGNVTFNVIQNAPFYATVAATPADFGGVLPIPSNNFGPLAGSTGTRILPRTTLRAVDENIKNAYAHFYSLAVEHRLFKDTVARVEYSGSKGRDLYAISNINRTGTGTLFLGSNNAATCPSTLTPTTRLNCNYNSINFRSNGGYSNYNGVNFSLVSNNLLRTGLALTANYTFSHAKDNLSSTFSESGNNFNLGFTDPFNPSYDYGDADFDIRHRLTVGFSYDVPFGKRLSNGFARAALGGFVITGIVTARSGSPYTIFDCTNASATTCIRFTPTASINYGVNRNPTSAGSPNLFNYLNLTGQSASTFTDVSGGTEVGPFPKTNPRNSFRGPGGMNVNLGVIKRILFSEEGRRNLQLRAEFINAFNMTNFGIIGGAADISNTDANGVPIGIQVSKTGSGPNQLNRTIQLSAKFEF